jgi:hypothetical protein
VESIDLAVSAAPIGLLSASPALPAASASVRFVGIDQMMKAGPDGRLP